MKILLVGGRFVNELSKVLKIALPTDVEVIVSTRKEAISVVREKKPKRIIIFGRRWKEIVGLGFDDSVLFHQKMQTLFGEKIKIFRYGFDDIEEPNFLRGPFFPSDLIKKFRIKTRKAIHC